MQEYLILTQCRHFLHPDQPGKRFNFDLTLILTATSSEEARQLTYTHLENKAPYKYLEIKGRRISKIIFEEVSVISEKPKEKGLLHYDLSFEKEDHSPIYGSGYTGEITSFHDGLLDFVEFERQQSLTDQEKEDLELANQLFDTFWERDQWYSHDTPIAHPSEVQARIKAYYRWQPYFESILKENPEYMIGKEHSDRRLTREFVLVSQAVWYWYELEEAAPLLEDALRIWKEYQQAQGKNPVPFKRLNTMPRDRHDYNWNIWHHAHDFWYINHYFLGQIYQQQGKKQQAIHHFQQFLIYEPNYIFDEKTAGERHPHFIYLKVPVPDSKTAREALTALEEFREVK